MLLRMLGIGVILCCILIGYEAGSVFEKLGGRFEFMPALVWWVSGAASAVLFFAIGMVLEQQEEMQTVLQQITEEEM